MLDPDRDCPLCPRLCAFRQQNRFQFPTFYNAPVPSFGSIEAQLLIVGLAPGLKGANQTGRPFTNDYAGIVLYPALLKAGFAKGVYKESRDDGLELVNARITNAVRCVPPENKPETDEIKSCNAFLKRELAAMPNIKVILSLGTISHAAVLRAMGLKASFAKFSHGAIHQLNPKLQLVNSYHTSRYNINTGTLTTAMFDDVIARIGSLLREPSLRSGALP